VKINFISSLAPHFELFQRHMIASMKWSEKYYAKNMKSFDLYCHDNYPNATTLSWEIAMGWCKKRENERDSSCASRGNVIRKLCDFLNDRGLASIPKLELPTGKAPKYIPHFFTDEELENFFKACDEIEIVARGCNVRKRAQKIMVPIYYRLLYSTGARTGELLMLKREDIKLDEAVISIEMSKGYKSRYVCIHDSMLQILKQYDSSMDKIYPNRIYFFPSSVDKHLTGSWVTTNFKRCWLKYNNAKAVAYDLRHNYAITHINALINGGFDTFDALMYLSKSMGHSSIDVTKYYYEITPILADTLDQVSGPSTSLLLPDPEDFEW